MKNTTDFSQTDFDALANVMNLKYAPYRKNRLFTIESHTDQKGIYVTTTLKNSDESFVYPVETRIAHVDNPVQPKECTLLMIDFIDAYFDEFFQEDEMASLPIDWVEYDYEGISFQVKGQTINLKCEKAAEELLGRA